MRRPLPNRVFAPISLLLVIALAVSACGSGGNSSPVATSMGPASSSAIGGSGGSGGSAGSGGSGSSPAASEQVGGTTSDTTGGLQNQMVSVIKKVNPAVVLIETSQGLGSGVVFDQQGDIVTNAHVAGNSSSFKVTFADGHSSTATLVGSFAPDDIAVIKVSGANVTPAVFGDSSKLEVGDVVLAVGNPLGLQSSVTEGIVSATGRQVSEPGGNVLPDVIQTSASINPGNSGGALVDLQGEVIGIPTLAATDQQLGGGAAPGIGFAISSDRAKTIATQLIQTGHVANSGRAFLGLTLADTGGQGVLVYGVQSGGPAAKAGVTAGDVITAINGQQVASVADLQAVLAKLHPGDTAALSIVHQDGSKATANVTLGQMPG